MVEKNPISKETPNTGQSSIEFDGKLVKPNKSGFYKCPFNCGDPRYPKPKWKTEKGFRQHMDKCPNSPSFINSKLEKEKNDLEIIERMKSELLTTLPYKIGDKIIYVKEIIVKPTHVQRGDRMVKVRYEAVKDFQAREDEIRTIDIQYFGYIPKDINELKHYLVFNGHVSLSSLCQTMNEAKERANKEKESYQKDCDFASMCR